MGANSADSRPVLRRRTVVKGAAWAAPVITVGAAAPASAASPPAVAPSAGSGSCRHTAGRKKRYHIEVVFTNRLSCATTVTIASFAVKAASGQAVPFTENPMPTRISVPAGGSTTTVLDSDTTGNIAQASVYITYTYTDCTGSVIAESQKADFPALAPCVEGYPHDGRLESRLAEEPANETTTAEVTKTPEPATSMEPSTAPSTTEPSTAPSTTQPSTAPSTTQPSTAPSSLEPMPAATDTPD